MHDQSQVRVPVNLIHSLPSKHQIGLVCPLIDSLSLSLCQVDCQASVHTKGMQSIKVGIQKEFSFALFGRGNKSTQRAHMVYSPMSLAEASLSVHHDAGMLIPLREAGFKYRGKHLEEDRRNCDPTVVAWVIIGS